MTKNYLKVNLFGSRCLKKKKILIIFVETLFSSNLTNPALKGNFVSAQNIISLFLVRYGNGVTCVKYF